MSESIVGRKHFLQQEQRQNERKEVKGKWRQKRVGTRCASSFALSPGEEATNKRVDASRNPSFVPGEKKQTMSRHGSFRPSNVARGAKRRWPEEDEYDILGCDNPVHCKGTTHGSNAEKMSLCFDGDSIFGLAVDYLDRYLPTWSDGSTLSIGIFIFSSTSQVITGKRNSKKMR